MKALISFIELPFREMTQWEIEDHLVVKKKENWTKSKKGRLNHGLSQCPGFCIWEIMDSFTRF
jgi:hypothetical protein